MAKHRIRWWLQFGVLDLLLLTTIVGVFAVLLRATPPKAHLARPWLAGTWATDSWPPSSLSLLPDGCYLLPRNDDWQFRWTMEPLTAARTAFRLHCGTQRLIVQCEIGQSERGRSMIEMCDEGESVKLKLEQILRWEGPFSDGMPDGTWKAFWKESDGYFLSLTYRHGEPVESHNASGGRELPFLNAVRKARGLPAVTERDFDEKQRREERDYE